MANRFIKGLIKDTSPMDQPQGSWRHSKNMVINTIKGGISNEKGLALKTTLDLNVNHLLMSNLIVVRPERKLYSR